MTPKTLVYGHLVMEIQAPFHILHVVSYDIQHAMQYPGFMKFPLSTALKDVGSEVVLL